MNPIFEVCFILSEGLLPQSFVFDDSRSGFPVLSVNVHMTIYPEMIPPSHSVTSPPLALSGPVGW